jgi:hypothetical protein
MRPWAHDTIGVPAFRLDQDHVGALVGEDLGGQWTHHDPRQVQYPDPGQRPAHSRAQLPVKVTSSRSLNARIARGASSVA